VRFHPPIHGAAENPRLFSPIVFRIPPSDPPLPDDYIFISQNGTTEFLEEAACPAPTPGLHAK
jgi:hypothetical protein